MCNIQNNKKIVTNIKLTNQIKKTANVAKLNNNDLTSAYSNLFANFNNKASDDFQSAKRTVFDILKQVPAFSEFIDKLGKNYKNYEVVFPKGVLKKLKSGEYIINKSKGAVDEFVTFVKDKKTGKMIKQLRLKEISNAEKLQNLTPSLQNMAVMQSLGQLSKQLESVEKKLAIIQKEFNNDRIGKIQAGYSAYLDAILIENKDNRNKALISAYKSLSEGRSQLIESSKSRLTEIETGWWHSLWSELKSWNYRKDQQENLKEFVKEVFYIQRSSQIILMIYQELKEPKAMMQSLAPLQDIMSFINSDDIIYRLNEWDKSNINWKQMTTSIIKAIENIPDLNQIENSEIKLDIK